MVALLDYPVEQSAVHGLLGLSDSIQPGLGGPSPRGTFFRWPLREVNCELKVFYSDDNMRDTGRNPLITCIEVVYRSRATGNFIADPNEYPLSIAPRLKAKLKASGLSLLEFTEYENLQKYYKEVEGEMRAERNARLAPNQSPQPTPAKGG